MADEKINPSERWVDQLGRELGASWLAIRKARTSTDEKRALLREAFDGKIATDTSLVLFGSIARGEVTSGSDSDWILLVDGQAFPEHLDLQHEIAKKLLELGFAKPGRSGVFGRMIGSHDIVHEIGGEDDTNANTTRRVLLLLESLPVGKVDAYDRVRRQILNRYVRDDRGLIYGRGPFRVPRFLLNDVTRYWRTVTVDFVYKQRAEAGIKWALRNAKLRLSRKLVFASGLLRCFFCHLDPAAAAAREALHASQRDPTNLLVYMENELRQTPLELLARAVKTQVIPRATAKKLFESYDRFLSVLDDEEKRGQLEKMTETEMAASPVWNEISELSRNFHSGLIELFFEHGEILKLTKEYGVF